MEEKKGKDEALKASNGKASVEDYFASVDFSKLEISMEDMFKSGVHFGHHKSRKNPKMNEFIFGVKNGINIFDLQKTADRLKEASEFVSKVVSEGQEVLFVGTKKQAKKLIEEAAKRCDMPYVSERWLGGTFTNFGVIAKRTKFLRDGQEKMEKGEYSKYTKFEQMKIAQELEKLERKMGGMKNMNKLPGAVFVSGVIEDVLAIKEAKIKNVPIIAITDTNVNPDDVDYPIPANDDAVSSLRYIFSHMVKAVLDGKAKVNLGNKEEEEKSK